MPALLKINGKAYPIPALEELTIDEAIVLERYSGLTFPELETASVSLGMMKGLAVVAVMRHEPSFSEREIERAVGAIKLTGLRETFELEREGGEKVDPQNAEGEQNAASGSPAPSGETSSSAPTGEAASSGETEEKPSGTSPSGLTVLSDRETSAA